MPTPVSCMMSCGSTGKMMPKPMESTSTAIKRNKKAPLLALRALNGILRRAVRYLNTKPGAPRPQSSRPRLPAPAQPVHRDTRQDDGERHTAVARIGEQRIQHHERRGEQKHGGHDRVTPHAVGTHQVRAAAAQYEHTGDHERVERPDTQDEFVSQLREIVLQYVDDAE